MQAKNIASFGKIKMENLPTEIWFRIFQFLDRTSRKQANLVCKKWLEQIRSNVKLSGCFKIRVTEENRHFANLFFQHCPALQSVILEIKEPMWFDFEKCPMLESVIFSSDEDLRDFFPQAPTSLCLIKQAVISPKDIRKVIGKRNERNVEQVPDDMKFPWMKILYLKLELRCLSTEPNDFARLWKLFEKQDMIEGIEIHLRDLKLFVKYGLLRNLRKIGCKIKKLKFLGYRDGLNDILEEIMELCPNITDPQWEVGRHIVCAANLKKLLSIMNDIFM